VLNTESEYYLHSNLNRRKWEKPTPKWTKKRFQKANCLQQRFAIAPHIPQKRSQLPTSQNSDRPSHSPKAIAPHTPKSELLAAALRYRIPHIPKAIAPPHPQKANCLQQRFAIALPPHFPKANCLQQRFAIAPPHIPKQAIALPNPQTAIALPHPSTAIALPHPKKRSLGLSIGRDGIRTIAVNDIGEAIALVVNVICLSNEIIATVSIFVDDLANGIVSVVHLLIALSVNSQAI
jgi:hypothetical protein